MKKIQMLKLALGVLAPGLCWGHGLEAVEVNMRKLQRFALIALVAALFTNAAYADQDCIQDKRTTFVRVMNGITTVLNTLDPTVWIARGILTMIPGEHNNHKPTRYCEDQTSDSEKAEEPTAEVQS